MAQRGACRVRWVLGVVGGGLFAVAGACSEDKHGVPGIQQQGLECISVALDARKLYDPSRFFDAEHPFNETRRFRLPETVTVTAGNAGNHWVTLVYRRGTTESSCRYRGGADVAHPMAEPQISKGLTYRFLSCVDGTQAGGVIEADYLGLHLDNGDSYLAETAVHLGLTEEKPCQGPETPTGGGGAPGSGGAPQGAGGEGQRAGGATGANDSGAPSVSGQGGEQEPGTAGEGGASATPRSTRCGDALRDPVTESCDDGSGSDEDACTSDCRLHDYPVVPITVGTPRGVERWLGLSPHALAASAQGSAVLFLQRQASTTTLWLARFGPLGQRLGAALNVGASAMPSDESDPALTALPNGAWAFAFSDLSSGSLDVKLGLVDGSGARSALKAAHGSLVGAQHSADLVWTGAELQAAWISDLNLKTRSFSANLEPSGSEVDAGEGALAPGSVALAPHAGGYAAAFRAIEESAETLHVVSGPSRWTVGPFASGAELERPALIALDDQHLLIVFTVGTDPLHAGTADVTRLYGAVLDVASPGTVMPVALESHSEPYASDVSLSQRHPVMAAAGSRFYLSWETESPVGDPIAQEVFVRELVWDAGAAQLTPRPEMSLPSDSPRTRGQRSVVIAGTPLGPEGAVASVWQTENANGLAAPDLLYQLRPSPFVF